MKRNYDECVTKYSDSFVRVVLDPGYVSRIQNFVTELVEAKAKEDHHKIDSNKEVKRFTTGFLGEAALEKLFGIPIINWTIGYYTVLFHNVILDFLISCFRFRSRQIKLVHIHFEVDICVGSFSNQLNNRLDVARLFNEKHTQPLLYKGMVERTFFLKI